jgi:transcriptional regulator with XRE-family HTH domain
VPETKHVNPDSSLYAWLAHDLRFYRQKHGMTLDALGKVIGRSESSLSNCEGGRRHITEAEANILDEHWNTGGHFRRLLLFARRNHNPDWFREHVSYEARATAVRAYEGLWVPGLVQTPDYASASFEAAGMTDLDGLVAERLSRQEILGKKSPPFLDILLDQAVIMRCVGGPEVMAGQLQHLADISRHPHVILRVIPFSEGAHMGQDGSFTILTWESGELAYVEAPIGGRLVTEGAEIRSITLRWARIGAKALPEGPSRDLILKTLETLT